MFVGEPPAVAALRIITFPGLVLNNVVREYYLRKHDVRVRGPDVEEITHKIENEKRRKDREDDFGEDTKDTVERMSKEVAYTDFYELDDYRDLFEATSVPFFVSSGSGLLFLFFSVPMLGAGLLYWLPPFWLGASLAAHSFLGETAAGALWQESGVKDSRLRLLGYPVSMVSKLSNTFPFWVESAYVLLLFSVSWYSYSVVV